MPAPPFVDQRFSPRLVLESPKSNRSAEGGRDFRDEFSAKD